VAKHTNDDAIDERISFLETRPVLPLQTNDEYRIVSDIVSNIRDARRVTS
jgi:hypothetical protein